MSFALRARWSASSAPRLARTFVARPKHTVKDPLLTASNAAIIELPENLTFVHRPPPTAETPLSYTTNPSSPLLRKTASSSTSAPLAPPLHAQQENAGQSKRLTQAQIEEIRARRAKDPKSNPAWKLAEEYGCSRLFISMVAPIRKIDVQVKTSEGLVQMTEAERRQFEKEKVMSRWGERKQINREVRRLRREKW
ncbi:hypothetical protein M407DRAFT_103062 [Tulasnella calospora MUT 4182]|uniref:Uncharacterized protein n=1 Tax=Tulasnella calospora MUT 4182 TaxID=1051891 RepID=A0A0C3QEF3_9AGAM|nr:hypothetical protein M407DRAFT_103062 [Tulasnella calospora MUT 4182]